jgi:O-antigen ligase
LSSNVDIANKKSKLDVILGLFLLIFVFSLLEFLLQNNPLRQFANTDSKAGLAAATVKFRDAAYRAQAFFENPLSLAHYVVIISGLLIYKYTSYWKVLLLIAFFIIIFTGSRVGALCLISALGLTFLTFSQNIKKEVKLIIVLLASLILVTTLYIYFTNQSMAELSSTATRLKQWEISFLLLADHWFIGLGPGNADYLIEFSEGMSRDDRLWRITIDSYVLLRIIESGYIAGGLLLIMYYALVKKIVNNTKHMFFGHSLGTYLIIMSFSFFAVSALFTVMPIFYYAVGVLIGNSKYDNCHNS